MPPSAVQLAAMIDLSCVRTASSKADIQEMVAAARLHGFGHVSVLQCFLPYTRELLRGAPGVGLVGNVSFPSGSDSTSTKIFQAREMLAAGCDEIDMVMNIGKLKSGEFSKAPVMRSNAHEMLAEGEFNRFYIRALCARAIEDGLPGVTVYRAKAVENARSESQQKIGQRVPAEALLRDLRTHRAIV